MNKELAEVFNLKNEIEEKQLWEDIGASVSDLIEFLNIVTDPLCESVKEKQDKLLIYALTESIDCYSKMKKYFDRLDEGCTSASAISVPAGKISNKPIRRKSVEEGIFSKKKQEESEPKIIMRDGHWSIIEDEDGLHISDGFILYDEIKKCEKVAPKSIIEKFASLQPKPVYEAQIIDFEDNGNFTVRDEERSNAAVKKSRNKGISREEIARRLEQNKKMDKVLHGDYPTDKTGWAKVKNELGEEYNGSSNYNMLRMAIESYVPFSCELNGHKVDYTSNSAFGNLFVDGIKTKVDNDVDMVYTIRMIDEGKDFSELLIEENGFADTDIDVQTNVNDNPNPQEDEKKIEELKPAVGNDTKKVSFIDKDKDSNNTNIETDATLVGIDDTTDVKKAIVRDKDNKMKMVSLDKVSLQESEEEPAEEPIEKQVEEKTLTPLEEEEQEVYDFIQSKGEVEASDLTVLERLVADTLYKKDIIKIRLDKTNKSPEKLSPADRDTFDMLIIDLDEDLDIKDVNILEKMGMIKKTYFI